MENVNPPFLGNANKPMQGPSQGPPMQGPPMQQMMPQTDMQAHMALPFTPPQYQPVAVPPEIPNPDHEISLKSLSKKEKEKIMASCKMCYDKAKDYFKDTIEPKVQSRTDIYNASQDLYKKKYPRLSSKTSWVSKDVQTAAEWIKPGLLEAFCGSEEPINIQGVDAADDVVAKKLSGIIKIQLEKQNNNYSIQDAAFDEALRSNFGITKLYWKYETEKFKQVEVFEFNDMDKSVELMELEAQGLIEIVKIEQLKDAPDLVKATYNIIKVVQNKPVMEHVQPAEILFTPDAPTLNECKFVAHRKVVKGDYLKRREADGIYSNVDKAIERQGNIEPNTLEQDKDNYIRKMRNDLSDNDAATKNVELIEAYIDVDYNDDGIAEPLIVHFVDDIPLSIEYNEFGFKPFFLCCCKYDPNKVFSDYSFSDLIQEHQDLKTALIKQVIINVAQTNAAQRVVDMARIDMDAFLAGDEIVGADVPEGGSIGNYVFSIDTPPISSMTMDLINYAQNEIESQTGSTRYNQGLDSNSLNRTATGITAIMGAAEKKAKMMARAIAENYYVPMIRAIIKLDQKYLKDDEIFRIHNETFSIREGELDVDFDLTINVGNGAGTKEARIQYLMVLLQTLAPIFTQSGIADENTLFNAGRNLLEEMGLRGVAGTLLDPQDPQIQQRKQQMEQQKVQLAQMQIQMQQQQEKNKAQVEILKALLPKTSIRFIDMPPKAKDKLMEMLGLGTDMGKYLTEAIANEDNQSGGQQTPADANNQAGQGVGSAPPVV